MGRPKGKQRLTQARQEEEAHYTLLLPLLEHPAEPLPLLDAIIAVCLARLEHPGFFYEQLDVEVADNTLSEIEELKEACRECIELESAGNHPAVKYRLFEIGREITRINMIPVGLAASLSETARYQSGQKRKALLDRDFVELRSDAKELWEEDPTRSLTWVSERLAVRYGYVVRTVSNRIKALHAESSLIPEGVGEAGRPRKTVGT